LVAKEFFPRIQGRHGHTGVAADLGNALVVGLHHLFDDLFFELRAIDWHEFHLSRPLGGLNLSLQETGQLS
jgi:hypothetical protein